MPMNKKFRTSKEVKKLRMIIYIMLLSSFSISAQTNVKGFVYSANDHTPLVGVTVIENGAHNKGTITDSNGSFYLSVNPNATIKLSYIGYKTIIIKAQSQMKVEMEEASELINDVVVTGYTTEKKADITGSVSVIKIKDIQNIPSGNIMSTLQGRVPGVNITNDGAPGGVNTAVDIRGITTINDNSPLYVIDGVQTRANIATVLNSNDVESIQVLKDAASAAIYGAKASNGVIIITTKKAKKGQLSVNADVNVTAQSFTNQLNMLNTAQWGECYWTAAKNDGITPSHPVYGSGLEPVIPEYIDANNTMKASDTNWTKECYGTGLIQNYNISVLNGTDRGSSSFGINYMDHKGTLLYTDFKRINTKINSCYNFLNNHLRVGENLNVARYQETLAPDGIEEIILTQHPIIPVHDINGGWAGYINSISDLQNPVRLLTQNRDNYTTNWRILGNMFMEIEPLNNLVLKSNFSVNYRNGFSKAFSPKWSEGTRSINQNSLVVNNNYENEWIWANTATYNIKLNRHSIQLLAGLEAKSYMTESLWGKNTDFLIEDVNYRYLSAGSGTQNTGGGAVNYSMYSQFGKVNYNYDDRYVFSGTLRRDASSRFGSNNNAGIFPSFSGGWRISKEDFMKDLFYLSDLKIRASWGKNGSDLIDSESTYDKFAIDNNSASYDITGSNNSVYSGVVKVRSGNHSLRWESTAQTNVGIDVSLFNNSLSASVDLYKKDTKDMLIDRPYIGVIGEGGTMSYNGASLTNKGFEAIITWKDKIKDYRYEITLNTSMYRNKITSLPSDIYYTWGGGNGVDKSIVGQPIGSWFGYKTNGLYKTTSDLNDGIDQPGEGLGRIRYVDLNNDKVINSQDREWLGSSNPKFSGGINIAMGYKQFDLSCFFSGMVRKAWNNSKFYTDFFSLWQCNHGQNLMKAWNATSNFNSNIPALTLQNLNDEGRSSDYFIEDGSYIKCKNIQLGYTLSNKISGKLGVKDFRVYVQTQDLFTITHYSGVDPEVLGYNYPLPKTFIIGINASF